mgnify:CR=1 FL=1
MQIFSHITRNEAQAESGERKGGHRLVHNDFTTSFGKTLLDSIIKETEDIASVLVEPKFENRTYSALLTPKKVK